LTLNLGLRYDFDNPPIDNQGGALYSIALNKPIPGTWNTNYNDYGPRVGFSWNALKNTVIRGGYGIYFSPILYNNLQFSLLYAPNFILESKSINIANPSLIENLFDPISSGNSGYTIAKALKDQSAVEWNLNIEHSFNDNTLLTVAYVGDVTRHMSNRADGNQPYALSPGNTSGILDVNRNPSLVQLRSNRMRSRPTITHWPLHCSGAMRRASSFWSATHGRRPWISPMGTTRTSRISITLD